MQRRPFYMNAIISINPINMKVFKVYLPRQISHHCQPVAWNLLNSNRPGRNVSATGVTLSMIGVKRLPFSAHNLSFLPNIIIRFLTGLCLVAVKINFKSEHSRDY